VLHVLPHYHRRVAISEGPGKGELLVLSRAEVVRLLDLSVLLDELTVAFRAMSTGRVSAPPRVAASSGHGMLVAMPGYVPGMGLGSKLVSVFPGNHGRGLPSHQALLVLFEEETGRPLALMDGTYITTMRTAGSSAVSTRLLALDDARVLAILGAGVQGRAHLQVLARVCEFHEVRVASRTREHAEALASTNPRARAMCSFEDAVRGADVVCCCTDAATPVLRYDWLDPGTHVTSVGANREGPELDRETVVRGRLFVESRQAFSPPPVGCVELQGLNPRMATELGEVLAGVGPGRQGQEEITVFKSVGHACEDAAAAYLVYRRALHEGIGRWIVMS
jgi:alanine dehydrogenase